MTIVELRNTSFQYPKQQFPALQHISLRIQSAENIALVGHSGAGKSTLARIMAGVLQPRHGTVTVHSSHGNPGRVGLVFQNPETQIIGLTVEEDVAFGAGNLSLDEKTLRLRVEEALHICNLLEMRNRPINTLSGGEKQRVAIAAALAMQPTCLILDEATAMLDQPARTALNEALANIQRQLGIALIQITPSLDEAVQADRIIVLYEGRIVADGAPWDVLWNPERLAAWRLNVPQLYKLARPFVEIGFEKCKYIRTPEELANTVWAYISNK